MPAKPQSRLPPTAVIRWLVVAGVLLTCILASRAASLGIDLVTDGPTTRPDWTQPARSGPPLLPIGPPAPTETALSESPAESPGLFVQAGLRVLDAALIVCVVLLLAGAARMWRRTASGGPRVTGWQSPRGVPAPLDVRAVLSTALEADDILDGEASPRNAIVECWVRLETIGSDLGIPRTRSETTTEYVVRLLEQAGADPAAVHSLAASFREARFSLHPITSAGVESARASLRSIRVSLGAGAWSR